MELSKRDTEKLIGLTANYLEAVTNAQELGVRYPGDTELRNPWTDVYIPFPTSGSQVNGLTGSMIHTRVSDLGIMTTVLLLNRSFIRLQLLGAGMRASELTLWDLLNHRTLANVGVSPVRRDYICNCEVPEAYPTLETLLHQSCELAYTVYHFEFDGLAHARSAKTMFFYLSNLLLATKLASCHAITRWKLPRTDEWHASPGDLVELLRHARRLGRVELDPVIFPCEAA